MSKLTASQGGIAVETPFDRDFVNDLKNAVPYADRKWHGSTKQWIVSSTYGQQVANLIKQYFGETVVVPQVQAAVQTMKFIQLMYLGRTKERNGDWSATGYADGAWSLIFPEKVLKRWFGLEGIEPDAPPPPPDSLYAVLGIKQFSELAAIKAAYKRLAKVTHPDVCKEPDAPERFRALQHAYDVLGDDKQRRRYDCGLIFEQRAAQQQPAWRIASMYEGDYRAPLTCGLLAVEGTERIGMFEVSNILRWDDIVNAQGQTMMSFWPIGESFFEVRWL